MLQRRSIVSGPHAHFRCGAAEVLLKSIVRDAIHVLCDALAEMERKPCRGEIEFNIHFIFSPLLGEAPGNKKGSPDAPIASCDPRRWWEWR
jgi:hypothetical protein